MREFTMNVQFLKSPYSFVISLSVLDFATVLLESVRAPEVTQEWTRFLCDLATTCAFPPRTTLAQVNISLVAVY